MCGVVDGEAIDVYRTLVADLFVPVLQEQSGWGKNPPEETSEFLHLTSKFATVLGEAVNSIHSDLELAMPDPKVCASVGQHAHEGWLYVVGRGARTGQSFCIRGGLASLEVGE